MKGRESLADLAKEISTKEDFVAFLRLLRKDFHQEKDEWENQTLEQFLEGLYGFSGDMDGYYSGKDIDVQKPSWRLFAEVLLASRVYE